MSQIPPYGPPSGSAPVPPPESGTSGPAGARAWSVAPLGPATVPVHRPYRPGALMWTSLGITLTLVIVASVVGLVAVTAYLPSGSETSSNRDLVQGDCFDDDALAGLGSGEQTRSGSVVEVVEIDCAEPHTFEVTGVHALARDEYPGNETLSRVGAVSCRRAALSWVNDASSAVGLSIWFYLPTIESWRLDGDRSVICVVGRTDPPLVGSLHRPGSGDGRDPGTGAESA